MEEPSVNYSPDCDIIREKFALDDYNPNIFRRIALASTGFYIRKYQLNAIYPIVESVLHQTGETFFIEAPRQSGKSTTIAEGVGQLATIVPMFLGHKYKHLAKGLQCGVFAPIKDKADLLSEKIRTRITSPFNKDLLGLNVDISNNRIFQLSNGSRITTSTASVNAKCLEGGTMHLGIIDEAQAVKDFQIMKAIRPQLAATNGTMVYVYTPSDKPTEHGLVYIACMKEKERRKMGLPPDPRFRRIKISEVFATPGTKQYRKFVLKEIKTYGVNHPQILSQYFGKWDADKSQSFMTMDMLTKCKYGSIVPFSLDPCVGGLDIAKTIDQTVLTVMRVPDRHILNWLEISGDNYANQNRHIKMFLSNYNMVDLRSEATGPGAVLNDFLMSEEGGAYLSFVNPVSTHENIRTERLMMIKNCIRNKFFSYPADECPERQHFEEELCSLQKMKKGTTMRIDHPTGGKSDFPDSLGLCLEALYDISQELQLIDTTREEQIDNAMNKALNVNTTLPTSDDDMKRNPVLTKEGTYTLADIRKKIEQQQREKENDGSFAIKRAKR